MAMASALVKSFLRNESATMTVFIPCIPGLTGCTPCIWRSSVRFSRPRHGRWRIRLSRCRVSPARKAILRSGDVDLISCVCPITGGGCCTATSTVGRRHHHGRSIHVGLDAWDLNLVSANAIDDAIIVRSVTDAVSRPR